MRYAEFCAGVGGFRLGIQSSDLKGEAVFVNEIDDSCEKTYEKNFHQKFDAKDIFEIVPETLPAFDMLCAGFPCQPFSVAGKELGFHDPRGTVFFKILEIIKAKQPNIVFLENVPNLIRHDGGKTYKTILLSGALQAGKNSGRYQAAHFSTHRQHLSGFVRRCGQQARLQYPRRGI